MVSIEKNSRSKFEDFNQFQSFFRFTNNENHEL
jgi:hypothetical protein